MEVALPAVTPPVVLLPLVTLPEPLMRVGCTSRHTLRAFNSNRSRMLWVLLMCALVLLLGSIEVVAGVGVVRVWGHLGEAARG